MKIMAIYLKVSSTIECDIRKFRGKDNCQNAENKQLTNFLLCMRMYYTRYYEHSRPIFYVNKCNHEVL